MCMCGFGGVDYGFVGVGLVCGYMLGMKVWVWELTCGFEGEDVYVLRVKVWV